MSDRDVQELARQVLKHLAGAAPLTGPSAGSTGGGGGYGAAPESPAGV